MRQYDSFRAITLRANRIDYISPVVCELAVISSGSGSSQSSSAVIPSAVVRKDGPTNLIVTVHAADNIELTWSEQSYIYSYAIYAGSSAEGPFVLLSSNVLGHTATVGRPAGTYFFKVTGIEPEFGETYPSNIVGPVIIT
jgi:fibronectin type 3 domain-containing protein